MSPIENQFVNERIDYDGTQLHSHFAFHTTRVMGNSIVAFLGACHVPREHLVDMIDAQANDIIIAKEMLHFIVELFGANLFLAIAMQRLLAALALETLNHHCELDIERRGDDLYIGDRKLSISIATVSPVSSLIHFALNVDHAGAPVPAIGLAEIKVEPQGYASDLLRRFTQEYEGMERAMVKVRAVL